MRASKKDPLHPQNALKGKGISIPIIPVCDHYAGAEKFIQKAFKLQEELGPIFDITCDCEDGAPRGGESDHVRLMASLIHGHGSKTANVGVRIHEVGSPFWEEDLKVLVNEVGELLSHITVPKVKGVEDLRKVSKYVKGLLVKKGVNREIPLHVLIETHGALREIWEIAKVPGVRSLDFGILDFIAEHGGAISDSGAKSPLQFDHKLLVRAKTEIVAASLANGVVPTHNICTSVDSESEVLEDAKRARQEFGFLRMWSIHPSQIKPIVEAMSPGLEEIEKAANILLEGYNKVWGPIKYEGVLHDRASYRYYWDVIQRAQMGGKRILEDARRVFFG